jgi:hypothetical protein
MQMIVDFMLLAASVSAAIYCFVLSGKLKRLNDMRSGLGASIASMSVTLEQMRRMLDESKEAQREAEQTLEALITDASRTAIELSDLVETVLETSERAAEDIAAHRDAALAEVALLRSGKARIAGTAVARRRETMAA